MSDDNCRWGMTQLKCWEHFQFLLAIPVVPASVGWSNPHQFRHWAPSAAMLSSNFPFQAYQKYLKGTLKPKIPFKLHLRWQSLARSMVSCRCVPFFPWKVGHFPELTPGFGVGLALRGRLSSAASAAGFSVGSSEDHDSHDSMSRLQSDPPS